LQGREIEFVPPVGDALDLILKFIHAYILGVALWLER